MSIVKYKGRELSLHKASINQIFGSRTVLTNSPWTFVALWLKRNKLDKGLFYWGQAEEFYKASIGLPLQSSPLLLYYSYMNAVKALLASKNINFHEHHGVGRHAIPGASTRVNISNTGIRIANRGVLFSLAQYYHEPEESRTHSLKEILFNLPFIHRTYCLSHPGQAQMFMPIVEPVYAFDRLTRRAYLRFKMSKDHTSRQAIKRLAPNFVPDPGSDSFLRSSADVAVSSASRPSAVDLENLASLRRQLQGYLNYINGAQTLWYIKVNTAGPTRIERQVPTLVLAGMHRLSELCRYAPLELSAHLSGKYNWLLSEFIQMSPNQFIDEIASELTGYQFQSPNVRAPT
ncbi:YaaC family protein [Phyllobacterium endophyticum]|uniref:Uncharacterized protein n=1 Tax=Phyllobacterium endophyticum TaxID=1149773 RepID=A0A2P7AYQ1_9HYPH|nr:YaaC family protein [Phyllobacterium endophyticum]MBB3236135.1 uncharacterized protein (UPF0332 family) [Phyllobacterium endophyticum]PSH59313.1 hypothetical protein CU100_00455 [Phyllobacterium endophyticum]TYR41437.1 hypothetical protein FY050_09105 [Phyllobacterium endophyticum]